MIWTRYDKPITEDEANPNLTADGYAVLETMRQQRTGYIVALADLNIDDPRDTVCLPREDFEAWLEACYDLLAYHDKGNPMWDGLQIALARIQALRVN